MEGENRLEQLYIKWFNKTASVQERAELLNLLNAGIAKEQLDPVLERIWNELKDDESFSLTQREQLANRILMEWPAEAVVKGNNAVYRFRRLWRAAAVVILLAGSAVIFKTFTTNTTNIPNPVSEPTTMASIEPGTEGAILTLADGRQIVLDSTTNGIIREEGNARISLKDNRVVYDVSTNEGHLTPETAYNLLVTQKGKQFQLVLPDGTNVWLNAASSIRYPVAFGKSDRTVEISGEVYFEVAHNKNWPFFVRTKKQEVQALGTSFNVDAYDDEGVEKTTLVEGSVAIKPAFAESKLSSTKLTPGQQAKLFLKEQRITVVENQSEAALAWKNGYFNLEDMPFEQVMKQLERWYDIQVVYENGVPDLHFVGGLSRQMKLDALIRTLQVSEVHFKMESHRRLIVYK